MCVDGEELAAGRIHACYYQIRANVALVAEEVLFEHGHDRDDTRFPARRQRVEFEVGGDEGGGEFGVCGCASAGTPDLRRDVVQFLAVLRSIISRWMSIPFSVSTHLVRYYRPARRSSVCGNDHAAIEEAANDGGTGGGGFGQGNALGVEGEIPVVVAKVEAGHCDGGVWEMRRVMEKWRMRTRRRERQSSG